MQLFLDSYKQYISPVDTLILAVSGGVDSMVLLHLFAKYHPKEKLIVVHFDHSLRGTESDGDSIFVAHICKGQGILCEVKKMDIGSIARHEKMSIEALARRERYTFLENVRVKYGAKYILTAHHSADQAETILLNMVKGAKVRGLSGMQVLSGNILRPLLGISKGEILAYQGEHLVSFREDSSNLDRTYERNRIRHEVVPLLSAINPSLYETLGELGSYMQDIGGFMREHVEKWLYQSARISGEENSFLIMDFLELDAFMQGEILMYLYAEAQGGSSQGFSRGLIAELTRFIGDKNPHGRKQVKNLHLERRKERIYF